jgi:hypothetical protein
MDTWRVQGLMESYYFAPDKAGWNFGDRTVVCMFSTPRGKTVRGSVRREAAGLDAHQRACLTAENAVIRNTYTEPWEEFPAAPREHREWAARTAEVLRTQAAALRGHRWPTAVAAEADNRARQFERAARHWTEVAGAKDEDAFREVAATAEEALDLRTEIAIRKPLGLETVHREPLGPPDSPSEV